MLVVGPAFGLQQVGERPSVPTTQLRPNSVASNARWPHTLPGATHRAMAVRGVTLQRLLRTHNKKAHCAAVFADAQKHTEAIRAPSLTKSRKVER